MAAAMGIPVPLGAHRRCSPSARPWRRPAACCSGRWAASPRPWAPTSRCARSSWWWSAGWATSAARSWPSIFISLLEAYASLVVSPAQAVIVSFVALILTLLFRPTGLFVPTPEMTATHRRTAATGSASRVVLALLTIAPLVLPRVLAALRDRDPHLGPAGDVVGHPDRLHRHGVLRPLGLLRARHVRGGGRAAHRQAAEPVAGASCYGLVGRGRGGGLRRLLLHPPARHLLRDHHAGLLADLLRHHLHLDGGHGRRERAHLRPARRSAMPGPARCRFTPDRRCTGSCWPW